MLHSDEVVDDPEDILDVWRLRRDNLFVTGELMVVPGSVSPDRYRRVQDGLEAAGKQLAETFSAAREPEGAIRLHEEDGWLEVAWSVDGRFD
jgi:hypothetical protein